MTLNDQPIITLPTPSPHSYYPYPLTSRLKTHNSILFPRSPHAPTSSPSSDASAQGLEEQEGVAGPSAEAFRARRRQEQDAVKRAEMRAMTGKRPAGVALDKEAEELSDEERVMDDERDHMNRFGDRFLLPYGRRQTQSELDAAPHSPTPSHEPEDRRQEDRAGAGSAGVIAEVTEEEVDLDADLDDMDAGGEGDETNLED